MTLTTVFTLLTAWVVLSVPTSLLAGAYLAHQEKAHPPRRVAPRR